LEAFNYLLEKDGEFHKLLLYKIELLQSFQFLKSQNKLKN